MPSLILPFGVLNTTASGSVIYPGGVVTLTGSAPSTPAVVPFRRKIEAKKMMQQGKYGQAKVVRFSLSQPDGVNFEPAATFEAGDVVIMLDEGAEANTTNLPVDEGTGYSLTLTGTELTAARIKVYIIDQTDPKVWLDTDIDVETYGHANAEHQYDLDVPNLTAAAVTTDMDANSTNLDTIIAMLNALDDDLNVAAPEPGQGTPAANANRLAKIDHIYKRLINKLDTDGAVENYYNNAGNVVDHKRTVTDAGGTTTKANVVAGP